MVEGCGPAGELRASNGRSPSCKPQIPVESATWTAAGELGPWLRDRFVWWGRVRALCQVKPLFHAQVGRAGPVTEGL